MFSTLSKSISAVCTVPRQVLPDAFKLRGADGRKLSILFAAVFCAFMPLEMTHLVSAVLGAVGYFLLQTMQTASVESGGSGKATATAAAKFTRTTKAAKPFLRERASSEAGCGRSRGAGPHQHDRTAAKSSSAAKPEVRKPSVVPVAAPSFTTSGWDAETEELLSQILPTPEGETVVTNIAKTVQKEISAIVPGAEVVGFACANLFSGKAFGVAVPVVDIVVNANPNMLLGRLQGRWAQTTRSAGVLDVRKLQKSAIRAFTDRLVSTGGFKFRRSAFRGEEPKVTMIAPASLSTSGQGIPINLSVNSLTPIYNIAMVTECGQMEPRTQALILLVQRWAKDRGLCHAAKGHLPPYAWTLLTIYFLQVGFGEGSHLLPPLEGFKATSCLMAKPRDGTVEPRRQTAASKSNKSTVGELFKQFIYFYAHKYDWRGEAISVRLGRRAPADLALPLHVILHEDGQTTEVGPNIEDPFEVSHNLGTSTTAASLKRLHEELQRAAELCAQEEPSMTALLEPWAPPDCTEAGLGLGGGAGAFGEEE